MPVCIINWLWCRGAHLSIKILSSKHRNSHYKDKMVSRWSYFCMGIPVETIIKVQQAPDLRIRTLPGCSMFPVHGWFLGLVTWATVQPYPTDEAVKLPWIFSGAPLTFNGIPEVSRITLTLSDITRMAAVPSLIAVLFKLSMGWRKVDITPAHTNWSYTCLALTHSFVVCCVRFPSICLRTGRSLSFRWQSCFAPVTALEVKDVLRPCW